MMTHDYKYENMSEEDRNGLIPAIRRTQERTQHAPGPWKVRPWKVQSWRDEDDPGNRIVDSTGFEICKLSFTGGSEDADARLIAAAPDLLAALKHLLAISRNSNAQQHIAAQAAIAKAEGR